MSKASLFRKMKHVLGTGFMGQTMFSKPKYTDHYAKAINKMLQNIDDVQWFPTLTKQVQLSKKTDPNKIRKLLRSLGKESVRNSPTPINMGAYQPNMQGKWLQYPSVPNHNLVLGHLKGSTGPGMLHELGHISRASKLKWSAVPGEVMHTAPYARKLEVATKGNLPKMMMGGALASLGRLTEEGGATIAGYKALKGVGAPLRTRLGYLGTVGMPFGTYLTHALGN